MIKIYTAKEIIFIVEMMCTFSEIKGTVIMMSYLKGITIIMTVRLLIFFEIKVTLSSTSKLPFLWIIDIIHYAFF